MTEPKLIKKLDNDYQKQGNMVDWFVEKTVKIFANIYFLIALTTIITYWYFSDLPNGPLFDALNIIGFYLTIFVLIYQGRQSRLTRSRINWENNQRLVLLRQIKEMMIKIHGKELGIYDTRGKSQTDR